MNPEQFAYWLQGFVENNEDYHPTLEQWNSIKAHLATVFRKITPVSVPNAPTIPPLPIWPTPGAPVTPEFPKYSPWDPIPNPILC